MCAVTYKGTYEIADEDMDEPEYSVYSSKAKITYQYKKSPCRQNWKSRCERIKMLMLARRKRDPMLL